MYFEHLKEVFGFDNYKTDKYFFTYFTDNENFYVVDVFVKKEFRKTRIVKELYDLIDETFHKSGKKFCHSMVQRKDPNFKNALSLNLKYGMTIIREELNGKIFLMKENKNESYN